LQDATGLKEAALKASNGGKRRIVGLYLPDGGQIKMEEKVKDGDKKTAEEKSKKAAAGKVNIKKDVASEIARKKTNLSEVAHCYSEARMLKQQKAMHLNKTEEQIEDEEASRKAKIVMGKSNEQDRVAYKQLFGFFDVDKDATWGSIEFAQRMTDIGFPTGVEDAANLLYFAGFRDVDRVTYNDFLVMMPKLKAFRRIIEKDAMKCFSEKDKGSGYISLADLREVIANIAGPEGADKGFVEAIVKKSNRENTGRVCFEFFIVALFGSKPFIPYERDLKKASPSQKLWASFGKLCGSKKKPTHHPDIGEDEEPGVDAW
jgi:Ca2+-binding EF-hand superfamily protein